MNIIHFKIRIKRVIRHADAAIAQEVALKNNQGNLYRACILHRIAQGLVLKKFNQSRKSYRGVHTAYKWLEVVSTKSSQHTF